MAAMTDGASKGVYSPARVCPPVHLNYYPTRRPSRPSDCLPVRLPSARPPIYLRARRTVAASACMPAHLRSAGLLTASSLLASSDACPPFVVSPSASYCSPFSPPAPRAAAAASRRATRFFALAYATEISQKSRVSWRQTRLVASMCCAV